MLRTKQIPSTSSHVGRRLRFESLERRLMFATNVAAPVITQFGVSNPIKDTWIFTGKVADTSAPVAGMKVQFGGVLVPYHITATVQKNGTFEADEVLPFVKAGWANAQTQDSSGDKSNVARAYVDSPDNTADISFNIRTDTRNESATQLTLYGRVTFGGYVAGQTVVFGGILGPYNISATVNADGTYLTTVNVPAIKNGTATAIANNPDGVQSEVAKLLWP